MWWCNLSRQAKQEAILFTSCFFLGRYSPEIYKWYKKERFSDQDDQPFRNGRVDEDRRADEQFSAANAEYMTEEEEKKLL